MSTKTYKTRDSATSALRKIGIASSDYGRFITKITGGIVSCDIDAALAYLESLKATKVKPSTKKAGKKVVKSTVAKSSESGISATARALILDGKTNQEVWEVLRTQFGLDQSKRHYPTWYRCEMKRKGLLPKDA
jgi:hypothetical protein